MTREEEKIQAANNYGLNARLGYPRVMDETDRMIHKAYIAGFDYADQHPRKGLVDIEKVIEYMKKNSRFKYLLETDWEVLEDLRKAMEE